MKILLVLSAMAATLLACGAESSFYVESAELQCPHGLCVDNNTAHDMLGTKKTVAKKYLNIKAHRIKSGKGVIVGYRKYDKGSLFKTDTQQYEKLTLHLPDGFVGNKGLINSASGAELSYSRGASAFCDRGWYAKAPDWSIAYEKLTDNQIKIRIRAKAEIVREPVFDPSRGNLDFDKVLLLHKRDLNSLTPWEGRESEHIQDEVHNR